MEVQTQKPQGKHGKHQLSGWQLTPGFYATLLKIEMVIGWNMLQKNVKNNIEKQGFNMI